MGFFLRR